MRWLILAVLLGVSAVVGPLLLLVAAAFAVIMAFVGVVLLAMGRIRSSAASTV